MYQMIKLLAGLLLLTPFTYSSAQKPLRPLPKGQWHVQNSSAATGNSFTRPSFRKNIVYLPNGGVVVAANFNHDQGGAVRMDDNGKALWNLKVKGVTTSIGRINNNFILFYSNEELGGSGLYTIKIERSSTIRAAIINGENGKLIKDVLVYDNGDEVYMESKALNRPDGSFSGLFIRLTDLKKGSINPDKMREQKTTSPKILIARVDDNFNVKITEIKSKGQDGIYIGAELGADDNLFFSTIIDDQLIVERFNTAGTVISKLSTPIAVRSSNPVESVTRIEPKNQNSLFLALGYNKKNKDDAQQMFEFNFASNKVSGSGEQILDKSYQKAYEVSEIKEIQNSSKYDGVEGFHLMNFLITDNNYVIVSEYQGTNSDRNRVSFSNTKVGIDIYDREWHRLKGIILDRKFEIFDPACRSVGANINNGKLYTVLPAIIGVGKMGTVYAQIDLGTLKVDKYVLLDDNYIRRGLRGPAVESDASIWLKDGVLIENCGDESGILSSKENVSSIWQKIEY